MSAIVSDARQALHKDLTQTGFYPYLVSDLVADEIDGASLVTHLVQLETHVERAEVHRHLTVLALTSASLMILHVDDQSPDAGDAQANVSAESVALARIDSVVVSAVYPRPDEYRPGDGPRELTVGVAWSGGERVDMVSAACQDPQCELDHGYTGQAVREDLVVRVSSAADGTGQLARARSFAKRLRAAADEAAQPRHTEPAATSNDHPGLRGLVRQARGEHR